MKSLIKGKVIAYPFSNVAVVILKTQPQNSLILFPLGGGLYVSGF